MAVTANNIITPQLPKSATVQLTTAQATFPPTTAPSNTVLVVTAGLNGARLTRLHVTPNETVTANHIQMFRCTDGVGTVKIFAHGVLMAAATVSATVQATPVDFGYSDSNPLILQPSERIYLAEGLTKAVTAVAEWADY